MAEFPELDLELWHRLPVVVTPKPGKAWPLCTLTGQWSRNTAGRWSPANPAQPVLP